MSGKTRTPQPDPLLVWPDPLLQPPPARLILQAPAGFGKTAWAAWQAQQWPGPVIWLTLDSGDNHVPRLLAHLALAAGVASPADATAGAVSQALSLYDSGLWIVDGIHLLTHQPALDLLQQLTTAWPATAPLILTSRHGGAIARWLVAEPSRWQRWQTSALRLQDVQVARLLQLAGITLDSGTLHTLNTHFDGWPALWRLWMAQPADAPDIHDWCGPLRDFLLEQWLSDLPLAVRRVLEAVSVPDWFDEPLAAAICDQPFVTAALAELRQRGLCLAAHGRGPGCLTVLPFMRDALRHDLSLTASERLLQWHQRALLALLEREQLIDAAAQALAAGDRSLIAHVLRTAGWRLYHQAAFDVLRRLFDRLGMATWERESELVLLHGWLVVEGERDCARADRLLATQVPVLQRQPDWAAFAPRMAVLQGEIACQFDRLDLALACTDDIAVAALPAHDRIACGYTRAMAALALGRLDEAEAALNALARAADAEHLHHHSLWVLQRRAVVALHREQFDMAAAALANAEAFARRHDLLNDSALDSLWRSQAELAQQHGDWAQAAQAIARGTSRELPLGDYWTLPYHALTLQQGLATGQPDPLTPTITRLQQQLADHTYCHQWQARAWQALLLAAVATDNAELLATIGEQLPEAGNVTVVDWQLQLLHLWVRWHQGAVDDRWHQTLATAARETASRDLLWLYHRFTFLDTLARADTSPPTWLMQWLRSGYQWDLRFAGHRGVALFEQWLVGTALATDDAAHATLMTLVSELSRRPQHTDDTACPDPRLTEAEWKVLQLMTRDYRNDQIAARLHVALSTVKSHINRIYAKLGVRSRGEARALAVQWLKQAP